MFGILVAGNLVQTDGQVVNENQMVFNLPDQVPKSVAVFLTGQRALDPNMAASAYLVGDNEWAFLGYITNAKPSAIFKIRDLMPGQWKIGIQLEPINAANQRTTDDLIKRDAQEIQTFTEKMCNNLYNYITSFKSANNSMAGNNSISMDLFERWFQNFQKKLKDDPHFWKRI